MYRVVQYQIIAVPQISSEVQIIVSTKKRRQKSPCDICAKMLYLHCSGIATFFFFFALVILMSGLINQ